MTTAVTTKDKQIAIEHYQISNPDATLHLATDLARFIRENRLFQNIQGKEFVNVEGWQYAGSRLGIVPIIGDVICISTESEIKYSARVNLLNVHTDQIVGAGFAICSNKEDGKKFYKEFAVASMAQTRAIGKAYRSILAWIIKAAGYEPTPAEEMDYKEAVEVQDKPVTMPKNTKQATAEATYIEMATEDQKKKIIDLLKQAPVDNADRAKALNGLDKLTKTKAAERIKNLEKMINEKAA